MVSNFNFNNSVSLVSCINSCEESAHQFYHWDISLPAGDLETAPVVRPAVAASRRSQQKLPRHIQRLKTQAERRNQKSDFDRSLPALNQDLETYKSSERAQPPGPESFSESSETESQQDSNGMDFVGFKKTRDFGDFVTFSNSPSQVWFLWIDWLLTASLILKLEFALLLKIRISASKKTLHFWKRLPIEWN